MICHLNYHFRYYLNLDHFLCSFVTCALFLIFLDFFLFCINSYIYIYKIYIKYIYIYKVYIYIYMCICVYVYVCVCLYYIAINTTIFEIICLFTFLIYTLKINKLTKIRLILCTSYFMYNCTIVYCTIVYYTVYTCAIYNVQCTLYIVRIHVCECACVTYYIYIYI